MGFNSNGELKAYINVSALVPMHAPQARNGSGPHHAWAPCAGLYVQSTWGGGSGSLHGASQSSPTLTSPGGEAGRGGASSEVQLHLRMLDHVQLFLRAAASLGLTEATLSEAPPQLLQRAWALAFKPPAVQSAADTGGSGSKAWALQQHTRPHAEAEDELPQAVWSAGPASMDVGMEGLPSGRKHVHVPPHPPGPAMSESKQPAPGGPAGVGGGRGGLWTVSELVAAAQTSSWDSRVSQAGAFNPVCPVGMQAACNMCVAYAFAAAAETAVAISLQQDCNSKQQLSQHWLYFCNGLDVPTCASGWDPAKAAKVLKSTGLPYLSCFPNYLSQGVCTDKCGGAGFPLLPADAAAVAAGSQSPGGAFSITKFSGSGLQEAKAFIRKYGGVTTSFLAHADLYSYTGGVYKWDGTSPVRDGHAVLVIGYNDVGRYWLAKNSWGSAWGENGYFKVGGWVGGKVATSRCAGGGRWLKV